MPFFNTSIMKILLNQQKSGLVKTTPAGPGPTPGYSPYPLKVPVGLQNKIH